eukprot:113041-Prorocentrum_minimum.AAC.2
MDQSGAGSMDIFPRWANCAQEAWFHSHDGPISSYVGWYHRWSQHAGGGPGVLLLPGELDKRNAGDVAGEHVPIGVLPRNVLRHDGPVGHELELVVPDGDPPPGGPGGVPRGGAGERPSGGGVVAGVRRDHRGSPAGNPEADAAVGVRKLP